MPSRHPLPCRKLEHRVRNESETVQLWSEDSADCDDPPEIVAAYDFVAERHHGAKVWVYGKSIGTTGALYLAAHRQPAALLLKNIIDVSRVAERRAAHWSPKWISERIASSVPAALDALRLAQKARCPALFVTSRHDQLALPQTQEAVLRAYAGPARALCVGGDHDQVALAPEDIPRYASAIRALWEMESARAQDP